MKTIISEKNYENYVVRKIVGGYEIKKNSSNSTWYNIVPTEDMKKEYEEGKLMSFIERYEAPNRKPSRQDGRNWKKKMKALLKNNKKRNEFLQNMKTTVDPAKEDEVSKSVEFNTMNSDEIVDAEFEEIKDEPSDNNSNGETNE